MRKKLLGLFLLFSFLGAMGQIHEIGIFAGGSNYIGDIGPTNYINPNRMVVGAVYKWNWTRRYALRGSLTQTTLESADKDSDLSSRKMRDYSFENKLTEFSAGIEFNFVDFDLFETQDRWTPYLYGGLSYFRYEYQYFDGGTPEKLEDRGSFALPMIVGVKFRLGLNWILAVESGARFTFTDNLDGSNPGEAKKELENLNFGNINSKDWYVFTGLSLTYTFGTKECYCR